MTSSSCRATEKPQGLTSVVLLEGRVLLQSVDEGIAFELETDDTAALSALLKAVREAASAEPIFDELAILRSGASFEDYAREHTFTEDAQRMAAYAEHGACPSPAPRHARSRCPEATARERLAREKHPRLCEILELTFGVQGSKPFHNHHVALKPVPSIGGRHGLEAYVVCSVEPNEDSAFADRSADLFYFDPFSHDLVSIGPAPRGAGDGPLIYLSCVFDRYQWRYRHSWIYQCIWFDLGHALAQLDALAGEDGTIERLEPAAHLRNAWPFVPLVAEPLVALRVALPKSVDRRLSIGIGKGPPIGAQKGPLGCSVFRLSDRCGAEGGAAIRQPLAFLVG